MWSQKLATRTFMAFVGFLDSEAKLPNGIKNVFKNVHFLTNFKML